MLGISKTWPGPKLVVVLAAEYFDDSDLDFQAHLTRNAHFALKIRLPLVDRADYC
jgi:hypothetical protein